MITEEDKQFIQQAIDLATQNALDGKGGPFAAIITRNGKVVAFGTNLVTSANDPTAHAEVTAIRNACQQLGTFQLDGCTIYASCEPCPMCLGAIYWARPDRLVFAANKHDAAQAGFADAFIYTELSLPMAERTLITEQTLAEEGKKPFEVWNRLESKTEY